MGAAKFSSSSFIFPSVLLLPAAFWEDGAGSQPGRARGMRSQKGIFGGKEQAAHPRTAAGGRGGSLPPSN